MDQEHDDDDAALEGFARLDAGLGVDADEMIAKARAIVADARRRKRLDAPGYRYAESEAKGR